ncbi:LysE family translocator [Anianabacter salinae]|uniref:LysE family translocator n=1 Tax=Anianabacter salinae TaxID=2851023 RepID=UPI00225E4B8B|nr:LysE family translocator [Anianabacter salinae]MBV0913621.1 LysE family translocator [Anianabacter salinae]
MTIPLASFLTVWAILALNILSPGPNVLNTITTAMGSGRPAGLASAAAVGIGIALWCLVTSLGLTALFLVLPGAELALTLVACCLLVWFASRFLRRALTRKVGTLRERRGDTLASSFLRSLSVNATNPKALTTWVAILGIFPTAEAGAADIALLTVGASALSVSIHTCYALLFSTQGAARAWLKASHVIEGATGLFFLGFAAKLAFGAIAGP